MLFATALTNDSIAEALANQRYRGLYYVYSDFEPIDARRAFPCFDDPRFKYPWSIAVTAPRTSEAFSNSPVASIEAVAGGKRRIAFERTSPLPSYLVAIAVGPFAVTTGAAKPVPMRVIMITANEGSRHKAYAEMLGVDDYIRKPFAMDRLMESVDKLLA